MTLGKKNLYCRHGLGLLCFKEIAHGGVCLFSWWHKHRSHQSEWGCVPTDENPTHQTPSERRAFEVQQGDLMTKQDVAGGATTRIKLWLKLPRQAVRGNLHSLKCSMLFHFQFIPTWKLRDTLKE